MTRISITNTRSYEQPLVNKAVYEHMERFNLGKKTVPGYKGTDKAKSSDEENTGGIYNHTSIHC